MNRSSAKISLFDGSRRTRLGLLGALGLCLLFALPALAAAAPQTVNFDSAPPDPNQPIEVSSEAPKITFLPDPGFRPYRVKVPGGNAKTGEFVGDVGRCADEALALGREPGGCEFAHAGTTAVLGETAEEVRLFAGDFSAPGEATLRAFNANGDEVAREGPKPVSRAQFGTFFEVKRLQKDIASFRIEGTADLGIDEVSVEFPGGGSPDFSISTTDQVVPIVQGQTAQVPVHISRLNQSSGAIELSVANLPPGVSAEPKEVKNGEANVAIPLIAEPSAPDTNFVPTEAKIVARPVVPTVGAEPRAATVDLRVAQDFRLGSGEVSEGEVGKVMVQAPDCAPADVPIKIARDIAMRRDVTLSVENGEERAPDPNVLPLGLNAEILPDAAVHPGGALVAERTLRLRAGPESGLGRKVLPLTVSGSDDPHNPSRTLELRVTRAAAATIGTNSGLLFGFTPRFGHEGSLVRLHGAGFCPGTEVEVGNNRARVQATFVDDHTLEFHLPRLATTGRIKIDPPGNLTPYKTDEGLVVDNVRNVNGFAFKNYPFHALGLDEFTKAFGDEEIFVRVNPCWPFGDCSFSTGFLNPAAAVDWGWMNPALRGTNGHCFGINLAIQLMDSGKEPRSNYTDVPGARSGYEMSTSQGPGSQLNDFLDAMHARQYSDEFLSARLDRPKSMQKQLEVLESEFSHERMPMIVLEHDSKHSHAVLAYDMTQEGDMARISVYDNENPFLESEQFENGDSSLHSSEVDLSTITIDKKTGTWEYPVPTVEGSWKGSGEDGSLWAVPSDTVPADPSLPSAGTLAHTVSRSLGIGSTDGSVAVEKSSPGAEFLPTSDIAGPAGDGVLASDDTKHPLEATLQGVKAGHYTQAYMSPGFTATTGAVATGQGVVDRVSGDRDSMTLDSGIARPLKVEVAQRSSAAVSNAATLETQASAQGSDTAGFTPGGALIYAHDGAPTTLHFSLTTVRREGGPSTFVSPPVVVRGGDRLRVKPLDRDLRRVRLVVRNASGKATSQVLRSRGGAPGRLQLGATKVSGRRLSMRFRLSRLHGGAIAGAVLRLMRGHHVLASHPLSWKVGNGSKTIVWRLPHSVKRGRYRLLTDLRVIGTGARGSTVSGSVSAHRAATVRVN
jgi:hypothetical protein